MVEKPEDTVWIGLEYFCAEGDDFWNMSEEDCVKFATAELVKMGVISENEVLDSHREKVTKAYPAYFDTYKHFDTMINGPFNAHRHGNSRGHKNRQKEQKRYLERKYRKRISRRKIWKLI